ncbi:HAD-IIB family hydrolase [Oricola sp.]|uniref:HAD-IIB family hydrolase n=1 Tax=Oricola sp. TaxID=1979950 RepID=UPI0025DF983C|nr:HAD-IIB family hydrolase [Oricola sp.]MCI5074279.1 HAD-IIB family hydrolase [Oricola sp.]
MTKASPLIVFSDLDGTLLDHATYAWDAARPALDALRERDIPLILASSKTAAEMGGLRAEMGFAHCPAIVENGAGLLEPEGAGASGDDGSDHQRLIAALDSLPADLRTHYSGFSDWGVDEVAARTGLPRDAAAKAAERRFSEPGLWSGDEGGRRKFEALLAEKGVTARQGGRYLTLSFGATKASRMAEIAERYGGGDLLPRLVALGDAPNDIEMLEAADLGIVVANPQGAALPELAGEAEGRIRRTSKPGPDGWNESVLRILEEIARDGENRT